MYIGPSVTRKKSPNIYKSCPKMISLEKWYILTPLQKLPKNLGRFGQINCCQWLQKVAQSPINRPIWSHWSDQQRRWGGGHWRQRCCCCNIETIIEPWSSLFKEESLTYQITSLLNTISWVVFKNKIKRQPTFGWMGNLSGKPVTPLYLKGSMIEH